MLVLFHKLQDDIESKLHQITLTCSTNFREYDEDHVGKLTYNIIHDQVMKELELDRQTMEEKMEVIRKRLVVDKESFSFITTLKLRHLEHEQQQTHCLETLIVASTKKSYTTYISTCSTWQVK